MSPALELREAGPEDAVFLRGLFASVRSDLFDSLPPEMRPSLTEMQFRAQIGAYAAQFPGMKTLLLTQGGAPVGKLDLHETPDHLHLVDIAVLPTHQSQGIGTQAIRWLQSQAGPRRIALTVDKQNPAQGLYTRLGFEPIGPSEDGLRIEMRWSPPELL